MPASIELTRDPLSVGRCYSHGEHMFCHVHEPERAIAIGLRDNLVIEVENPEQGIDRIRDAIAAVATLAAPA